MIILTGGAGFIGSNVLHELNRQGVEDIIVVDDLSDGHKFSNIVDGRFTEYLDKDHFRRMITTGSSELGNAEAIIHLGACSDTTEWDGKFMLDINYAYSKDVLHYCLERDVRMVYASSAAVYGLAENFEEDPVNEKPLNVYGYSKLLFDRYLLRLPASQRANVVGLRYFNVYGPREYHKGKMASVFYHFNNQLVGTGELKLFAESHGCGPGEHRRDFIHVDDAVKVTLWMTKNADVAGVFNCGTGVAETFNCVASAIVDYHGGGDIGYVQMPTHLHDAYQSYTRASLTKLRSVGYDEEFVAAEQGTRRYLDWLTGNI
jgi:ADP-L-glycero-D-manno-heptose 6-epimerase